MMRHIPPYSLWLGHAGDARNLRAVLDAGILALVDLALEEPPHPVTRELAYFRLPLLDGAGNPPWLLRAAVEVVASLLRSNTPVLVCCGAGMSRSPAVAAAAIAVITGRSGGESLAEVTQFTACDVSPALWRDLSQFTEQP